jgi:hypothetical protein
MKKQNITNIIREIKMKNELQKIPISIQFFEKLITNNYYKNLMNRKLSLLIKKL